LSSSGSMRQNIASIRHTHKASRVEGRQSLKSRETALSESGNPPRGAPGPHSDNPTSRDLAPTIASIRLNEARTTVMPMFAWRKNSSLEREPQKVLRCLSKGELLGRNKVGSVESSCDTRSRPLGESAFSRFW
jgi:hypothetical protein